MSGDHLLSTFRGWVARTPDATAVEDAAGQSLSYGDLDRLGNRLAAKLVSVGVRRGDRVGVCMPKSIRSVMSIHGILKAGAAYVPMDYSAPAERNRYIAENCQMRAVCSDEPRWGSLALDASLIAGLVFPAESTEGVSAPWLDEQPATTGVNEPSLDDLSYILYTSGSTGVPKGVMHTHRSALSFVRWCVQTLQPSPTDRLSSHAPFHFDLSILDLYVPLEVGACVVLVGEALGKDPRQLAPYIANKRITVWYSVPSILALLAQHGQLASRDYAALRTVLFAGEVFPIKHLRALVDLWPGKAYYNLYGPTETNVCTYYKIPDRIDPARETPYPIGVPCSNVRSMVVDDQDRPVADGEEGLLLIHQSGPVMRGYWNLPEQSARAFYIDPAGERWYRTGDVVKKNADGDWDFLGRRDRMVKRHGYRIELGEIEAALYRHPQVKEAAAVAKSAEDGVRICAYLATKDGQTISIVALKQFCAANLPAYMNPDRFLFLEKLPRTSTDKTDYQTLTALP
jgi:amino acid adenylation domain-containing protein